MRCDIIKNIFVRKKLSYKTEKGLIYADMESTF